MYESLTSALSCKRRLSFHPDGHFRILLLSDIHGGAGYAKEQTARALSALLDAHHPDLVLFLGDTAGPGVIHIETADQLGEMLSSLTAPLTERSIPWAHVYGNHDDNYGLPNEEAQSVYESFPLCLSKAGPRALSGCGNYVLPIYAGENDAPAFCVWGLDSHHSIYDMRDSYGFGEDVRFAHPIPGSGDEDGVHFDQMIWYYQTSLAMEQAFGRKIPSVMVFHIPVPEFALAAQLRDKADFVGYQGEQVACSVVNPGLFSACLQRGDVKGIFCGHDHENDFLARYGGIYLGYDGFLSYHACHDESIRGGRVVELHLDRLPDIETYMVRVRDAEG